ncbi:DUF3883 domain-containing protein [Dactylosporangium sp. NPDC005572]|uniref:sacsin N-terminal ATP-binding-like domain-containing protein n=1 Tax=Dactylosporangium sp. NPDC005572 TaxID=3156889 RepID=UPI0033A546C1
MREEFRRRILTEADGVAKLYLYGKEIDQPATREQKEFIEGIVATDYDGRTLVELLQNGHDAHPSGVASGRLEFLLREDEGPWGVLYVANGGRPVGHGDFTAMCHIAMSNKRPDEGIGNKGVGFKSVLQLADSPEIYSRADADSGTFDGYCFRFAQPGDFDTLATRVAPDQPGLGAELRDNVASLKVPVPLDGCPDEVYSLQSKGFATVVRLVLRSAEARDRARRQLNELTLSEVPFHLFLDRVAEITVTRVRPDSKVLRTVCARRVVSTFTRDDLAVDEVALQGSQRFLVLRLRVGEDAIKEAIARSRSEGHLSRGWEQWRGAAQVCVALPLGMPLALGRLYTFLPMGEGALAPLAGFVNAPFFARLDRRSLDATIPLNNLLLDQAAVLCARVTRLALDGEVDMPAEVVLDLVTWQQPQLPRLIRAFEALGEDITEVAFIPALGGRHPRAALNSGWLWESKGTRFTSEAVAAAGIDNLIDPGLHPHRLRRLKKLATDLQLPLDPSDTELAAWAEAHARRLGGQPIDPSAWAEFYDDLAKTMRSGSPLAGRRILIDEHGHVISAGTGKEGAVTVFISPQQGDGDDTPALSPPAAIAARLAFTHPGIPWRFPDAGRKSRPGRIWLEQHDLLREYRTDAVLDLVGSAMQAAGSADETYLRACLTFAFEVWHNTSRNVAPEVVARAGLLVPVLRGWRPARGAQFGIGWTGPHQSEDDLLTRFLARTAQVSRSLDDLAGRVIPNPQALLQDDDADVDALRVFLEHAGVQHGLMPVWYPRALFCLNGERVGTPEMAPMFSIGVAAEHQQVWRDVASRWPRQPPQYPTVEYEPASDVAVLPGQFDYHTFDRESRRLYAELLLHGLDRWPDTAVEFQYKRANYRTVAWPTLLAAFLASAEWLPQTTPGQRSEVEFQSPADAWWLQTTDTPDYLPAQPASLRNLATARVLDRLRKVGIRYWDDPATAAHRLVELTGIVASGALGARGQLSLAVRKAYEAAWRDLINTAGAVPANGRLEIVASRTGRLLVVPVDGDDETVYVAEESGVAQERLLQQAPILMLPIRDLKLAEQAHDLLKAAGARCLRSTGDAEVSVTVDGTPAVTAPHAPLLAMVGPWLTTLILSVMEFHSRVFPPTTAAQLTQAAHRLDTATITVTVSITTSVDGHVVQDPRPSRSFLLDADDSPRLVVAGTGHPSTWRVLQAATTAIAELVGMPTVADTLRLALVDLQQRCGDIDPTPADIAVVLGIGTDDVTALMADRASWLSDLSHLLPVLACLDVALAEELRGVHDQIDSSESLRTWLTPRLVRHHLTAEAVLDLADRGDLLAAVRTLEIDLADANAGLRAMALPPLHNRDGHARQFTAYLQQHRQGLEDRIRDAFLPVYRAGQPLQEYLRLRHLPGLVPDEAWLDGYWDLPDDLLADHAERWLHEHVPDGTGEAAPISIDATREANRRNLSRILSVARPLVEAWLQRHTGGHGQRPADFTHVADIATEAGFLDFERLTSHTVVTWLKANDQWPTGMPPTTNQTELGLTDQDIIDARQRLDQAKDQQHRAQTYVTVDGKTYSNEPTDLLALADAVRATISPQLLDTAPEPSTLVGLDTAAMPSTSPRAGEGRIWSTVTTAPPPETLRLIGLTGEIVAGEWLRRQYGIAPEDSWVSSYRKDILGDSRGDDSLGYDFRIVTADRVRLFEVKTTTGEHLEFTLGETEVRRAQNLASEEEYAILFITHVLNAGQRRIILLPNPLGHGGLGHYRVVGRAIRLQFELQ